MKLSVQGLALAGGVLNGAFMFLWTLVVAGLDLQWSRSILNLVADYYPYYTVTIGGSFLGLVYGFIDGFICLGILAWLYNQFSGK